MFLTTLPAILAFVAVHLFIGHLKLTTVPRSRWLSLAGGVSVTYVFLHVLPEFADYQTAFRQEGVLGWLEHHVYNFALLGLVVFYGLERAAKRSTQSDREPHNDHREDSTSIFWVHMLSFVVYNFIIGYLLPRGEAAGGWSLVYYTVAMAFHFVVNDYGLYDHYRELYRRRGRWLVTAALAVGWVVGLVTELPEIYLAAIFSFVAGGVIMNVLKEELPEERRSSLVAFVSGVAAYALLLALT
jgi:zinc transporter ZupT